MQTPPQSPSSNKPKNTWVEVLALYGAVVFILAVATRLPIAFVKRSLQVLSATLFLYAPMVFLLKQRPQPEADHIKFFPLTAAIKWYAMVSVCTLPLFAALYVLIWHYSLCHVLSVPSMFLHCSQSPASWPLSYAWPPSFFLFVLGTVFLIALPEEYFFRGYLQTRLGNIMKPAFAIGISSALFAIAHVIILGKASTALVFFPGLLFGWLRQKTGSITAGILFHASCNLLIALLQHWFS